MLPPKKKSITALIYFYLGLFRQQQASILIHLTSKTFDNSGRLAEPTYSEYCTAMAKSYTAGLSQNVEACQ